MAIFDVPSTPFQLRRLLSRLVRRCKLSHRGDATLACFQSVNSTFKPAAADRAHTEFITWLKTLAPF